MKKIIIFLFGLVLIPVLFAKSAQAVSPTDLVGWWKLDETTGTTVYDSATSLHNGTNYGALVGEPGKIGTSYRFDGVDDYIEIPETDFDITGPLTVEGWIKPNNYNEVHTIVSKWRDFDGSDQRGYALAVHPNGRVLFDISFWGWDWEEIGTDPSVPLPLNEWSHLAGTWDGTEMQLYVNGELKSSWSYIPGTPLYSNDEPVLIGATDGWGGYGRHFSDAYIDDVRIWARALSAEEIVETMAAVTPEEAIDELITEVQGLELPLGSKTLLLTKLKLAKYFLNQGRIPVAKLSLYSFIQQVERLARLGLLSEEVASGLVSSAQQIIASI